MTIYFAVFKRLESFFKFAHTLINRPLHHGLLYGTLWGFCGWAATPAAGFIHDVEIVRDGQPQAVVVVDREAYTADQRMRNPLDSPGRATHPLQDRAYPESLKKMRERHIQSDTWPFSEPGSIHEAATVLVEKIERATGAELPVEFETPATGNVIYLGDSQPLRDLGVRPEDLEVNRDGFAILFPDERSVAILGKERIGTEFGVYEFLERYAGVRWLMPGEDGVDVPETSSLAIAPEPVIGEPGFWSRRMTNPQSEWNRRLRIHNRIDMNHFLWALFWVEDYLESHPHFFPMDSSGQRMDSVPGYTRATARSWQPCFSADGIVEEAVDTIVEYFDLNPEITRYYPSFSIGINDGTDNFCQCSDCLALITGGENVQGYTDYSAPFFQWVAEVAEGVAEHHPDKYLYALAYQHTFEAPDFELPPNVVVGISYDWMRMIDPEIRQTMEGVLQKWSETGATLRTGEYLYGRSYLLPRVYSRFISEFYQMMHQAGVEVINSQAMFTLGEIPKYYAAAKMKWDPYLDIEELLEDWYLRCAGEASAPYVRAYFDFWEDFWTRRILETDWGRHLRGQGTFLPFRHSARAPTYLLDVTDEEMAMLREWMEAALANAEPGAPQRRMENLFKTFEYYEATRLLYQAGEETLQTPEQLIERMEDWIQAGVRRETLVEEVFPEIPGMEEVRYSPANMPFLGVDQVVRLLWSHRDILNTSEEALAIMQNSVSESGDARLVEIAGRIADLGEEREIDLEALERGLVLHLPLNEGRGARAMDQSGFQNDGVIEEPVWIADTPAGEGYSLGFGPDAQLEVSHDESLSLSDAVTVSFWIKLKELGNYGWYWMLGKQSRRGRDANLGWLLSGDHQDQRPEHGGRLEPRANAGGSWGAIAPHYTIPAERWFHVVGVYDHEEGGQLYIDALEVSPTGTRGRGPLATNEAPLEIAPRNANLYDLRIYNRVLDADEVSALYTIGRQSD